MPSQVNKDGDAREAMDIEQDADVELKVRKPAPKSNAYKQPAWKRQSRQQNDEQSQPAQVEDELDKWRRELFIAKNRDGPKHDTIKVRLAGQHFRFEPEYI